MRRATRWSVVALACLALLAGGCSSSDSGGKDKGKGSSSAEDKTGEFTKAQCKAFRDGGTPEVLPLLEGDDADAVQAYLDAVKKDPKDEVEFPQVLQEMYAECGPGDAQTTNETIITTTTEAPDADAETTTTEG